MYSFNKFVPKLLHDDQSKSLVTAACAFSISNACMQAYGTPSFEHWKTFSQPFVRRLRQVLSEGYGVSVGIPVFGSWALSGYSYKLPFPLPTNEFITGYHALSAVSFTTTSENCTTRDDLNVYWDADSASLQDAGCLILRNSWGADAGKTHCKASSVCADGVCRRQWLSQHACCIFNTVPVLGVTRFVFRRYKQAVLRVYEFQQRVEVFAGRHGDCGAAMMMQMQV